MAWSPVIPGDAPTWVPTSPSVDPVWRSIDELVDALELEGSVGEVILEGGFRLLLEQTESNANWVPVVT